MAIHFLNDDNSVKSVEYIGKVLNIEKNTSYQIMSDIWDLADKALVWCDEMNRPKTVYIRFCDYTWSSNSYGEVDATDEVKAKYRQFLIRKEFERLYQTKQIEASQIVKGAEIEVIKGRKVPKHTQGKVIAILSKHCAYTRRNKLVLGVATSDVMVDVVKNGKTFKNYRDVVWVDASNTTLLHCPRIDIELLREMATSKIDKVA
jgi:hypothetical protein